MFIKEVIFIVQRFVVEFVIVSIFGSWGDKILPWTAAEVHAVPCFASSPPVLWTAALRWVVIRPFTSVGFGAAGGVVCSGRAFRCSAALLVVFVAFAFPLLLVCS